MDGYIDRRQKKGDKPASINRVLEILRRAYRLAKLVPPDITRLEENNARTGFLSRAEFDRLNEFLPADLRDFSLFAFLTGMRLKEIKSLTWSDVTGNVVQLQGIHAKTKKRRTLVCAGELGPLLERLKRARTFTDAGGNTKMAGTLFHRGGEPVGQFRKSWKTACDKAGVDRLFHDFRRSALRNLIRSGVSQSVAMQISGHRRRAVFDRYNVTDEEDIGNAFVSLEQTQRAEQQRKVVSIAGGAQ